MDVQARSTVLGWLSLAGPSKRLQWGADTQGRAGWTAMADGR